MSTKQKLEQTLKANDAPLWMIFKARQGGYDDFESNSATPIVDLVVDLENAGLKDLAQRARDGEFDSTEEEAQAWFAKGQ